MARIRSIKPEFWADEKISPLDDTTRLVFLGLISMADDLGRLVDSVKQVDAFIFPHSDSSARDSLATLSRMGRIQRGKTSSGQPVIQIVTWSKHQRIDHPNVLAALPQLVEIQTDTECRDTLATDSRGCSEDVASRSVPVPTISTSISTSTNDLSRSKIAALEVLAEIRGVYPKRKGNNWRHAETLFLAHVRKGVDPAAVLAGAKAYAAHIADRYANEATFRPSLVQMITTFLGPRREWESEWGPIEPEKIFPYVDAEGIPCGEGDRPNPEFLRLMASVK